MACRGVLFALTADQAAALKRASFSHDRLVDFVVNQLEEPWDEPWLAETDKAWDAIHRCFNGGQLTFDFVAPMQGFILGGEPLHQDDDYVVVWKSVEQVVQIAEAAATISAAEVERLYDDLDEEAYGSPKSESDREYTSSWFSIVAAFYARAAAAGRSVVFTVDQ